MRGDGMWGQTSDTSWGVILSPKAFPQQNLLFNVIIKAQECDPPRVKISPLPILH